MSIKWRKYENKDGQRVVVEDGETHVGLVMSTSWTKEVRIMSDVYADATMVRVWNPEKNTAEVIQLGTNFEGESRWGTSTVDIDPAILAAWEAAEEAAANRALAAQALRDAAERESQAEIELKTPRRGAEAIVVKGRKVPIGTRGTIVWEGDGQWGPRVCLLTPSGEKHYTATSNIEVIVPGLEPGETPDEGWVALRDRVRSTTQAWKKSFPKKGDHVELNESGVLAEVFWAKDERLGVKPHGAPRNSEPIWVNAWEVTVKKPGGDVKIPKEPPVVRATPKFSAPPKEHPLANLPHPLCLIRNVECDHGVWGAFDEDHHFIMRLSEEGALDILSRLENHHE